MIIGISLVFLVILKLIFYIFITVLIIWPIVILCPILKILALINYSVETYTRVKILSEFQ